jgi:hypothetical protein
MTKPNSIRSGIMRISLEKLLPNPHKASISQKLQIQYGLPKKMAL